MKSENPFNIVLMDVSKFISDNGLMEVTSPFIHSPSSSLPDPDGIFSERIFGQVASQDRLIRMGYIDLHCRVLHPVVFQNLMQLKRFYTEIMSGKSYAIWNPVDKDFERANDDEENADTGYTFFIKHFNEIDFKKNNSLKRNDKVEVIVKYRDRIFIDKCLVAPAGIRDLDDKNGRIEKDSINTLYISLLERTKAMPPKGDMDPIYDSIHYGIQRKVLEIYEYLLEFMKGKRGFFEGKYGARSVAQGTRNVITSASMEASSPESPQYHKQDEIKVPLYQAAKGYSSLVVYWMKALFYGPIIQQGADNIPLIDPITFKQIYLPVDDKDKDALLTTEGINKMLDRFRDVEYRWKPVTAHADGKPYYLYLVYDTGNEIWIFRNLEEFKTEYKHIKGKDPDVGKVRPLSYAEMVYIATYHASKGRSGSCTRYPVTDEGSIFVAKTHLVSTAPGRVVKIINSTTGDGPMLPEYPIIGKGFIDALMFHPMRRAGLSADFDGDTVSWIPILGDEANEECDKYYHSISNFIFPTGGSQVGTDDLCDICVHCLTVDPPAGK